MFIILILNFSGLEKVYQLYIESAAHEVNSSYVCNYLYINLLYSCATIYEKDFHLL